MKHLRQLLQLKNSCQKYHTRHLQQAISSGMLVRQHIVLVNEWAKVNFIDGGCIIHLECKAQT